MEHLLSRYNYMHIKSFDTPYWSTRRPILGVLKERVHNPGLTTSSVIVALALKCPLCWCCRSQRNNKSLGGAWHINTIWWWLTTSPHSSQKSWIRNTSLEQVRIYINWVHTAKRKLLPKWIHAHIMRTPCIQGHRKTIPVWQAFVSQARLSHICTQTHTKGVRPNATECVLVCHDLCGSVLYKSRNAELNLWDHMITCYIYIGMLSTMQAQTCWLGKNITFYSNSWKSLFPSVCRLFSVFTEQMRKLTEEIS